MANLCIAAGDGSIQADWPRSSPCARLFTIPAMSDFTSVSSPSKAPLVAVVDDDESVREALGNLLMSMGLEVQTFGTAEDFLASPLRYSTACLVSDIQLPGMGGLELQRRIAADGASLPIILITAFPRDHVRRQAEQQGAPWRCWPSHSTGAEW